VLAEIALLKISKLADEYGLTVQFVAPELIMQALLRNEKISRFGIRELERIIFDMFASHLAEAQERGASEVVLRAGDDGKISVSQT